MPQCLIKEDGIQCQNEQVAWIFCRKHLPLGLLGNISSGTTIAGSTTDPPPPNPPPHQWIAWLTTGMNIANLVKGLESLAKDVWPYIAPHLRTILDETTPEALCKEGLALQAALDGIGNATPSAQDITKLNDQLVQFLQHYALFTQEVLPQILLHSDEIPNRPGEQRRVQVRPVVQP
jgi:hypothetical protein